MEVGGGVGGEAEGGEGGGGSDREKGRAGGGGTIG